ncbi:MAG: hypothetical protein AAB932_05610 [Patescibacteria group bacterium]
MEKFLAVLTAITMASCGTLVDRDDGGDVADSATAPSCEECVLEPAATPAATATGATSEPQAEFVFSAAGDEEANVSPVEPVEGETDSEEEPQNDISDDVGEPTPSPSVTEPQPVPTPVATATQVAEAEPTPATSEPVAPNVSAGHHWLTFLATNNAGFRLQDGAWSCDDYYCEIATVIEAGQSRGRNRFMQFRRFAGHTEFELWLNTYGRAVTASAHGGSGEATYAELLWSRNVPGANDPTFLGRVAWNAEAGVYRFYPEP